VSRQEGELTTAPASSAARLSSLAGLAGAVALAAALALVLATSPPSPLLVAGGAAGLAAMLALAVTRYELAVALGFLLLGVVRFEPAPADAVLAVLIALAVAGGRLELRRVPTAILVLVALLITLNIVSLAAAAELEPALRFLCITLYLAVFAVWLTSYLRTERRMRLAIGAYVAGAAAMAALSVLALFVAYPGYGLFAGEPSSRAQGLFKDPNVFAPFLIPAALILFEETLRPRLLKLPRRLNAGLLAVLALGILFAYSRAAWLNLGVALMVMLIVLSLRADSGRAAAGALALVAVVAAVAGAAIALTGSADFLQERARVQTYDSQRFGAQRGGLELAAEHPLGVGPGQFELAMPVSAHSLYVRVLAEQGFLGLAVLLALVAATLALALGNALAGRDAFGVGSAAALGAWCGLLANSAFVDTLHWRHLWLVAALIWVAAATRRRLSLDPPMTRGAAGIGGSRLSEHDGPGALAGVR
jgi:O-antigen ligase